MSNSEAIPDGGLAALGPHALDQQGIDASHSSQARSRQIILFASVLLSIAVLVPIISVKILPLIDYPDHLGRMYALISIDRDPILSRFYMVRWHLVPNLAMDLFVPLMAPIANIFVASKMFVILTMALMLSGPFAISAALFRRISPWPLAGFLFVYNWIFMYGFTNFLFGVGVALWAIAAWIRLREAPPLIRFLVSTAFCLILFISHLHALGLYGLTILCYEVWRWRAAAMAQSGEAQSPETKAVAAQPSSLRARLNRRLATDLAVFVLPFLLMLPLLAISSTANYAGITAWHFHWKIDALWYALKNFWTPLDLAIGAAAGVGLVWGFWTRRLVVHPFAWYTLAASAVVFIVMPFKLFGSSFADSRLPIAMLFIVIGMMRWRIEKPVETGRFAIAVGSAALLRIAIVGLVFSRFADVYRDFEQSFQTIPPGSRIFTTRMAEKNMRETYANLFIHIPTLAMAERSSLETLAFTDPGKQVLITRPEYSASVPYEGWPPLIECVARNEMDPTATDTPVVNLDYYRNWWKNYDYLYVLYARPGAPPPAEGLALAYQGSTFQLYRIEPKGSHEPNLRALHDYYGDPECGEKGRKAG